MYTVEELLLIENMTYIPDIKPFTYILDSKGMEVADYINAINLDELIEDFDYASYVNGYDWKNIINAIKSKPEIMRAQIVETHIDEAYKGGGGVSFVLINKHSKEAVVAFRGTALKEWKDDFIAANEVDSLQQINALEWYKSVYEHLELEKYDVTVIGHSKGGNKAKYITILNDTPKRCVSFDGQGFSDLFFEHYRKEILLHQEKIENHNVDYDYVNIIMNDIGNKTYYFGYDYGRGGFAEAHCPNTFFNFKEDGSFEMRVNPNGQSPEMQILDQFLNSMIRSALNEKERSESNELVGKLVEKAFSIGTDNITPADFISYLCDTVGEEKYIDNAAYLLTFTLKYSKTNPEFLKALKDIMTHFKANSILKVIDMLDELVNSKMLNALINVSNFLVLHVNKTIVKKIQSVAKKKYDIELTKEQITKVLQIVSMTKEMMKTLELNMDGSDLVVEEIEEEIEFVLPENLNIVVLAGGLSSERNVSLKTGYAVKEVLTNKGHNVILLDSYMGYDVEEIHIDNAFDDPEKYTLPSQEISDDVPDLWAVKKRRRDKSSSYFGPNVLQICKQSDLVFIVLHGANGENGKVQATFDLLGIDYTGCNHFSSALSSNKYISKQILKNAGIVVPKGYLVERKQRSSDPEQNGLEYPVIVKPNNGGIGLGISVVNDKKAYNKALKEAFKWDKEVIIEEYISGREFAVGTLDGKALPVLEILPLQQNDDSGLTFEGETKKKCPAEIDKDLAKSLKDTAEVAAKALGLKQYSKSDFIVRDDNTFVCLECDSLPHLSPDSHLVTEVMQTKLSFEDFCEKIIEISLIRKYH